MVQSTHRSLPLSESVSQPQALTTQYPITMIALFANTFGNRMSAEIDELVRYFDHLSMTQWGVISTAAVAFGFICLRSTNRHR